MSSRIRQNLDNLVSNTVCNDVVLAKLQDYNFLGRPDIEELGKVVSLGLNN